MHKTDNDSEVCGSMAMAGGKKLLHGFIMVVYTIQTGKVGRVASMAFFCNVVDCV